MEASPPPQIQQGQQGAAGVRLEASSAAITGAVGGFAPAQDARALFFGQPNATVFQTNLVEPRKKAAVMRRAAAIPVAQQLGIRYSILRRLPNREMAATIPNEALDANDQIVVRFESNEAGYVSVFERAPEEWRLLNSGRLDRLAPYLVPASGSLTFDAAGRDLFVVFSRQPQQTPYPVPEARLDQIISPNPAERVTYVVSTAPPASAQTIAFPINLTRK